MKVLIFGAKSIALGIYRALTTLCEDCEVIGFVVSSYDGNSQYLADKRVYDIQSISKVLTNEEKKYTKVLVATPQDIHEDIVLLLKKYDFCNYDLITAKKESNMMEKYFEKMNIFPSIHNLEYGENIPQIDVYVSKFVKDKQLKNKPQLPYYASNLMLGSSLLENKDDYIDVFFDDDGYNISKKNANYCEMTAFYWIWKNRLDTDSKYVGMYHYRRFFDIDENDLKRMQYNDVDVLLLYPTIHEPDIKEHHARYVKEEDWQAMLLAFNQMYPDEKEDFERIFSQEYFYNYNIIIAKKHIFFDYCEWVFPIFEKIEEYSIPRACERSDRYIAYMSESLFTYYFLKNKDRFNIYHTGRLMFV